MEFQVGDRVRVIETFTAAQLYDIGTVIISEVGSIFVDFDNYRPGFNRWEYDNKGNRITTEQAYWVPEHRLELYDDKNLKRLDKLKEL